MSWLNFAKKRYCAKGLSGNIQVVLSPEFRHFLVLHKNFIQSIVAMMEKLSKDFRVRLSKVTCSV